MQEGGEDGVRSLGIVAQKEETEGVKVFPFFLAFRFILYKIQNTVPLAIGNGARGKTKTGKLTFFGRRSRPM
jgi:hypothetical protein